ncbi:hypothetical protein CEXT_485841 [Caerostris extrusa]|uniref:Cadherin domain-containing protein n=1 Tax=Caerostris extrusa TaxID=172846 RepID=A0AAV4R3Z4_CAEEX|nr:hypothetical protein CEXT_485841 [Caerostris extrusa]
MERNCAFRFLFMFASSLRYLVLYENLFYMLKEQRALSRFGTQSHSLCVISQKTLQQRRGLGEGLLNFAVSVVDKDSVEVNDFVVRIEGDSRNLFAVRDTQTYGNLGNGMNTFFSADIESISTLSFPDREYKFTVVIEDRSLLQDERMVFYNITVVNETELELNLQEIYEVNVSVNAAPFARKTLFVV